MSKPFSNRFSGPRLAPDAAARQGRASRIAFETLRRPEAVIAFLNTYDEGLGGRPLDLAVASAEGLLKVEQALAAGSRQG